MALKKSDLYASLWSGCDELRGGMDASQYKDYVLVLAFVAWQGDVELQTDDGQRLQDRDVAGDLIEDWDLDLAECQSGLGGLRCRRAPKLVHKLLFSMSAGTHRHRN